VTPVPCSNSGEKLNLQVVWRFETQAERSNVFGLREEATYEPSGGSDAVAWPVGGTRPLGITTSSIVYVGIRPNKTEIAIWGYEKGQDQTSHYGSHQEKTNGAGT
jgi:hypothetical protein